MNELIYNADLYINNLYEWFCSNMLSPQMQAKQNILHVLRPRQHLREDLSRYNIHIGNSQLFWIGNDCLETSSDFLGMYRDENLTCKQEGIEGIIFNKTSEKYITFGKSLPS